jgi:ParB family transcriptional regulator, chromosome partitioning protein
MTTSAAEKLPPAENGPTETPTAGMENAEKPVEKRRALGRGLDSLLPAGPRMVAGSGAAVPGSSLPQEGVVGDIQAQAARGSRGEEVLQIELERIEHNPYQTRRHFDQEMMQDLAESIRANGVVQPIVVRPGAEGKYVLILGERRCRASKLAGKTTIPAIVRRVSEQTAAEMTIVENLQRQDLNCMEQATAFAKLSQKFGLTQEQIGQRVGMARETVSNYMRLLKLPGTVMDYLLKGQLGFSEARSLLRLEDNAEIARVADEAVKKDMSFIQLDDLVASITMKRYQHPEEKQARGARWVDPNVRAAQSELQKVLGVKVKIRDRKGKGKIVIEYASLEDFDRVVGMLKGE